MFRVRLPARVVRRAGPIGETEPNCLAGGMWAQPVREQLCTIEVFPKRSSVRGSGALLGRGFVVLVVRGSGLGADELCCRSEGLRYARGVDVGGRLAAGGCSRGDGRRRRGADIGWRRLIERGRRAAVYKCYCTRSSGFNTTIPSAFRTEFKRRSAQYTPSRGRSTFWRTASCKASNVRRP